MPLIHKIFELYKLSYQYIKQFPKQERYNLGKKIEEIILEILKLSVKTVHISNKEKRISALKEMDANLHLLKIVIRLTKEINILNDQKYINLQKDLQEIGKMIGGWIKYLKTK